MMNRLVLLAAWLMLAGDLSAAQAADDCLKRVFQDYCLGGSLSRQLEKIPAGMRPQVNGERRGVVYTQDAEKVYVMAYRDTIYKILHTFEPETRSTLLDLRRRLERKYGDFQDLSEYPEETKNKARQMSYIRRGEGELKNVWQPPGHPWRVELSWTRKLGVAVTYFVNELDRQQREAALRGL